MNILQFAQYDFVALRCGAWLSSSVAI